MEEKRKLLSIEKNKIVPEVEVGDAVGDALDAYMSGLSSQLGGWHLYIFFWFCSIHG